MKDKLQDSLRGKNPDHNKLTKILIKSNPKHKFMFYSKGGGIGYQI